MTIGAITISTGPYKQCLLAESARWFGLPVLVTQQGRPWVNRSHNRIDLLYEDLRTLGFDSILYADGEDAVFVRPDALSVAEAALASCGKDFLVGGEVSCWPWPARHAPHFRAGPTLRYPNAGCWVATRAGLDREFRTMLAAKTTDDGYTESGHTRQNCDQGMYCDAVLAGTMAVDTVARLVLNLNEINVTDSVALRQVIRADGPALLHGSGRAKDQVRRLWRQLCRLLELAETPRVDQTWSHPTAQAMNSPRGLQDMLRELPPLGRVAEIGCFQGVSTEIFALLAREVVAIDSWEGVEWVLPNFQRVASRYPHVTVVRERSPQAASRFPNDYFDLVYIDGDHRYEPVKADLLAWLPKVRPGGWIAGHDYTDGLGLEGVVRAVNEILGPPERVFSDRSWYVRRPYFPSRVAPATPTLSIIIPTIGQPGLAKALASIKAQGDLSGVEVILAVDGDHPGAHRTFLASGVPGFSVGLAGPHRDWGHTPTNLVMHLARNAYLMRLDDDNVYEPGALDTVRAALTENPGRPHIFRVRRGAPSFDALWLDPVLKEGNVDTQMFVVPNNPARLGRWGHRYAGDYDFITATTDLYPPGAIVWRSEIIGVWRPEGGNAHGLSSQNP